VVCKLNVQTKRELIFKLSPALRNNHNNVTVDSSQDRKNEKK